MLKIPRYNMCPAADGSEVFHDQSGTGDWCKWEDVEAALGEVLTFVQRQADEAKRASTAGDADVTLWVNDSGRYYGRPR